MDWVRPCQRLKGLMLEIKLWFDISVWISQKGSRLMCYFPFQTAPVTQCKGLTCLFGQTKADRGFFFQWCKHFTIYFLITNHSVCVCVPVLKLNVSYRIFSHGKAETVPMGCDVTRGWHLPAQIKSFQSFIVKYS